MKIKSTFHLNKEIWKQLSKRYKIKILINLLLILISSFFEIVSLSVIYPLLAIATDSQEILNNPIIFRISKLFNVEQEKNLLIIVSFALFVTVIISSASKLISLKYSITTTQSIGAYLTSKALANFLYEDYEQHINRNSSEIIATINKNIDGVIAAIEAILMIITNLFLCLSILLTLSLINLQITFYIVFFYSLAYLILTINSKRSLLANSQYIVDIQPLKEKSLYESLNAIREIILSNLQNFYLNKFKFYDEKIRRLIAMNAFITSSFRYYLEGVTLILISVLILILTIGNSMPSLALLGLFAIGAQKLLPSMQTILRFWSTFRAKKYQIIKSLEILNKKQKIIKSNEIFKFKQKISLVKISHKYRGSDIHTFENISLTIYKGEFVGIKGVTGSGKSTLIDIIMSLIKPSKGKLIIDDKDLHLPENQKLIEGWRNKISHVPQNIFISDESFAQNIAFGIDNSRLDFKRIKKAAELAQISGYIESTKRGYQTTIGEKGLKISGGQKQRIAIARALYQKSELLIMDEATSALDNKTEDNIMKTINNLKGKMTIILIAHRLRTLKACERIIEIKNGQLIEK